MAPPADSALPSSTAIAGARSAAAPDRPGAALDGLMEGYARGEDALFADLYRHGAPRVRALLVRLCGSQSLAEDLTQETFLRVHLARGTFARGAPALPWVFAIARNALRDHARREQVRRSLRGEAEGGRAERTHAPPDTEGDKVLAGRDLAALVRATLEQLPVAQREAFVLLRFEGLSVSEAAQVVGATEAAVKLRAFRASEALRAAMAKYGVEGGGGP